MICLKCGHTFTGDQACPACSNHDPGQIQMSDNCFVCDQPFTLAAWNKRHTYLDADVHQECCPKCHPPEKKR